MEIIGARWTEETNILLIRCKCGQEIEQYAAHVDFRSVVMCPICKHWDGGSAITGRYVQAGKGI